MDQRSFPPLRVAIVGCGNVAYNDHAPALLALRDAYQVVALVDPSADRRVQLAGRLGADGTIIGFASLDEALATMGIDMVDVCTPPGLHRAVIERAMAAGCHVLCEKPLATTPADAQAIVEIAAASRRTFATVHNYLWFPEVMATRDLMAHGAIGSTQVVLIDSLGVDDNPGVPAYRPRWRHEAATGGGGVLMDLIHLVYLAEALLPGHITRVTATVDAPLEATVESVALCRFDTDDGGSAVVNVGWGVGPGGMRVSGTDGRIEVRYRDGGTGPYAPIESATLLQRGRDFAPIAYSSRRDTHRAVLEDLARAVASGGVPAADAAAGARAVGLTVAAYASAALGRTIQVPLEPDDPVHRLGVRGIAALDLPTWSIVRRRGLYGVGGGG